MASFESLKVWQKSRAFSNKIFQLSKEFPNDEKYRLVDQLIRSSRSIPANIAEGHGRYHFQENIQFCRVARGSMSESLNHLICACDCNYITENRLNELKSDIEELQRIINGYINHLKSRKDNQ